MGFFSNFKKKTNSAFKRPLASNEDYTPDDFAVEDKSYSYFKKLELKVLRCDGVAVGLRIPTLLYPLKKPSKPRIPFLIFSFIALALIGFFLYYTVNLTVSTIIPLVKNSAELESNPNFDLYNSVSLGFLEMFKGLAYFSAYMPIVVFALFTVAVLAFLVYFLITFLNLATCSIQEMAKGDEVQSLVVFNAIALVLSSALCGLIGYGLLTGGEINSETLPFILISTILFLFFLVMLISTLIEKKKAQKEFSKLPSYEQEDFIAHARAIKNVKRRIRRISKYAKSSIVKL